MNKLLKFLLSITVLTTFTGLNSIYYQAEAATATPVKPAVSTSTTQYITVSPIEVVNTPAKYLNKNITFDAEFVAFTSLGLDYKPAMRDSAKYIGMLIKRDENNYYQRTCRKTY